MRPPALALLALLATGCLRPAEEQVELDRTVGHAEHPTAAIRVADGLAAIEALDAGRLDLWIGAPAIDATLTVRDGAPRTWTLTARNTLADAALTLDGAPAPEPERPLPTEATWTLDLPPGRHTLRLAPPDLDAAAPWRFAVLSDVQRAIGEIDDITRLLAREDDVRFLVSAGDLTDRGERDEYRRFREEMRAVPYPFYATPGNHERGDDARNWTDFLGRANYTFTFRDTRFSFIDSSFGTVDPTVYDWLDDWLAAGRGAPHVVVTHIPIMDPVGLRGGQFRSRKEAGKLLVRLARAEVDLALFGHVHSYYAFSLAGIPAYISGGGGALPERLDGIGRHYLVVEVAPGAIEGARLVRVD
ncbi:MAG: metallophosphoesterase [bacterium]